MSSAIDVVETKSDSRPSSWGLWLRQIRAIFWLEIEKNFLSRRSLLIYLLAFLPLFPLSILALLRPFVRPQGDQWRDFNQVSVIYSVLYNGFILRTVVFFGSAW